MIAGGKDKQIMISAKQSTPTQATKFQKPEIKITQKVGQLSVWQRPQLLLLFPCFHLPLPSPGVKVRLVNQSLRDNILWRYSWMTKLQIKSCRRISWLPRWRRTHSDSALYQKLAAAQQQQQAGGSGGASSEQGSPVQVGVL